MQSGRAANRVGRLAGAPEDRSRPTVGAELTSSPQRPSASTVRTPRPNPQGCAATYTAAIQPRASTQPTPSKSWKGSHMKIHMRCLALASAFTHACLTETRADSSSACSGSARTVPRMFLKGA
jgi:hypothetical protein